MGKRCLISSPTVLFLNHSNGELWHVEALTRRILCQTTHQCWKVSTLRGEEVNGFFVCLFLFSPGCFHVCLSSPVWFFRSPAIMIDGFKVLFHFSFTDETERLRRSGAPISSQRPHYQLPPLPQPQPAPHAAPPGSPPATVSASAAGQRARGLRAARTLGPAPRG